jgi:signal transduction histidine kinase
LTLRHRPDREDRPRTLAQVLRPQPTVRWRLTLVYGLLFLVCGAALLAITYWLFTKFAFGYYPPEPNLPLYGTPPNPAIVAFTEALAKQRSADLHRLQVGYGVALASMALVSGALAWLVAGRVLAPLRTITATAERISDTNLHERLALPGPRDELRLLADTIDRLLGRLDAAFDAQRHFVANASHELRTPLTRERTLLQVALGDPTTPEIWRSTGEEMLTSNRGQETLIEALLALASSQSGVERHEPIDLSVVARTVLRYDRPELDRLKIHLDTTTTPSHINGDPNLIDRLVSNLVDNAIRHNVAGGSVRLSTDTTDGKAVLSITNTGPVIPPSEIDRIFQPFQRLDGRRTGHNSHGLGLSIVKAIAAAHSAAIAADAPPSGGLAIVVTFPPAAAPTDA